ncbi:MULTISPECIES: M20 family metallopeptidase [Carnobacterium]|uniref:M20 family metallopeptidase n=1 Tax=Carnobacterium TaxID=2747 RepID=UPI00288F4E8D|nr:MULTISPECIES: M20 family metallopeptidase [Carnobacterium]MDT1939609.1 M20 family metallopeptidase [Carnobacterium divergens]MDT1942047.1 M20 family metallopeptidase [Carnobacterium divergens]MDT1947845.1 M20 family metallopeptidase [Carnobacterium divergens]MDT1950333.1 M20 family metallopeptidase [Carnobacterium divergens]MDT1955511.1 M20 family metallopeptidase [Carnobacterium divergens]
MGNLKASIQKYEQEMIAFRRDLHQHPELQWEEFRTTQKVADEMDKLGISYRKTVPTGLIAEFVGGKHGKTVALRADMDALPVQELNEGLAYQSLEDGKMHACGHDAHTAMLVTAAKALKAIQSEIKGTVRFIFQPSEENAKGAKAMVEQGAVEGVDNVFGIHIWSQMPSGKVSCVVGSSFASADIFTIDFTGRGGHGAMPDACIDATMVASSFVMNVQAIVSRETHPLDPVVVTIGRMDVGTRFNVIAENARLEGTVRCFSIETRERVKKAIQRYAEHTALTYGATAAVDYQYGTLPVVNDEKDALFAQKIIQDSFGEDALLQEPPTTGGEDFSYFTEHTPGCFALVGCGNPDKDTEWAHHHGKFNVDEDAMKMGAEMYAQYAYNYLNN